MMLSRVLLPSSEPYELPPYNGFCAAERRAVTPIQNEAMQIGRLQRPTVCSICGFSDPADLRGRGYIFARLEDYRRPLDILPCCKSCHVALHARFRNPARWQRILARDGKPGRWFMLLSLDPESQVRPFDETYPHGLPGCR